MGIYMYVLYCIQYDVCMYVCMYVCVLCVKCTMRVLLYLCMCVCDTKLTYSSTILLYSMSICTVFNMLYSVFEYYCTVLPGSTVHCTQVRTGMVATISVFGYLLLYIIFNVYTDL